MAPDNSRMTVNVKASMVDSPKAKRHKTELAANATSAKPVKIKIFKGWVTDRGGDVVFTLARAQR